jgi:hypothetical protein
MVERYAWFKILTQRRKDAIEFTINKMNSYLPPTGGKGGEDFARRDAGKSSLASALDLLFLTQRRKDAKKNARRDAETQRKSSPSAFLYLTQRRKDAVEFRNKYESLCSPVRG